MTDESNKPNDSNTNDESSKRTGSQNERQKLLHQTKSTKPTSAVTRVGNLRNIAADHQERAKKAREAGVKVEGVKSSTEERSNMSPVAQANLPSRGASTGVKEKKAFGISVKGGWGSTISAFSEEMEADAELTHIDMLDVYAIRLLDMLHTSSLSTAQLQKSDLYALYRYFYKTNPVIGRVIDLHTDLPLSKMSLTPPSNVPKIASDYIMHFYNKVLDKINFPDLVRKATLAYWIYGSVDILIGDDYEGKHTLMSTEDAQVSFTNTAQDVLTEIENRYDEDPDSVNVQERKTYLSNKFQKFIEEEYKGPTQARVIDIHEIWSVSENKDINYRLLEVETSASLLALLGTNDLTAQDLVDIGYNKGFLKLFSEDFNLTEPLQRSSSYMVDNDHLSGKAFIVTFERPEGNSLIHRVLDQCINWDSALRSWRAKIEQIGKVGRVISAPDLSGDQLGDLRAEVEAMIEDPNYALVCNYTVEWEEVNSFVKEELNELIASTSELSATITNALGIPDSMLSGDGQYSGDQIKLDMVNTAYSSFKNSLAAGIEAQLMEPIALRKGFVTVGGWGELETATPKVALSKTSLRDTVTQDIIFSMWQKGAGSARAVWESINIDPDEIKQQAEQERFTSSDPFFGDMMSQIYNQAATDVYMNSNIVSNLIKELNIGKKTEEDNSNEEN